MKNNPVYIWSLFVRLSHWIVATCILIEWFNDTGYWHRSIGYCCVGLVMLRVIYGLFSQVTSSKFYWPTWQMLKQHGYELMNGATIEYDGHNPLGQWAVYLMWFLIMCLAFTGWLSTTDAYWGEDWPVALHQDLSSALMIVVGLHIFAVFIMSFISHRHLLKQMVTGKRAYFRKQVK